MARRRRNRRAFPWWAPVLVLLLIAGLRLLAPWLSEQGIPLFEEAVPSHIASASRPQEPVTADKGDGLSVYFLDVGQGDSALITTGDWNMLIDTGEYEYADGLTEYLQDLGVKKIDALVCSHPHTDHMGCMARIVQRFEIGTFYMPRVSDDMVPTTSAYEALLNAVEKKNMKITTLESGTEIGCPEEFTIEVFSPRPNAQWENMNNWSAILRLSYGETSFLFTGDAERGTEDCVREDAAAYGWDLGSTVLKCSHHGSNDGNPSKWLKAVNPQYAVMSCGKDNPYGHPHKEPLERLEKLGTEIYRTDRDGTILAKSDGKAVTWETGLPSVQAREWE